VPVLLLLPLILIFIKDRNHVKTISLFILIFTCYQIILKIPLEYNEFDIINGKQNWTGKLLGIFFGLLTYSLLYRRLEPFNFLRFKQEPKALLKTVLASSIMICTGFFSYFDSPRNFDIEILAFQLTMPGFDEEIMFRGILLALLLTCLQDKIKIVEKTLGNPSIFIIAVLFGLAHGFSVTNSLEFRFEFYPFICTFVSGYVLSWITVESKSILFPVLSHNIVNFIQTLMRMIK